MDEDNQNGVQALQQASCELQVMLLSNRAEAFLRCRPPKHAAAASTCRAALELDPASAYMCGRQWHGCANRNRRALTDRDCLRAAQI